MSEPLREVVSDAIWQVYRDAESDGPNPCDEAAEMAIGVVLERVCATIEALPDQWFDAAGAAADLHTRSDVLAAVRRLGDAS